MMEHLDQVAIVTILFTLLGLAYDAGRKAEQIRELREWRTTIDPKLSAVLEALAGIKAIIERRRDSA